MLRRTLVVLAMALAVPVAAQAGQTITGDAVQINYHDAGNWNWDTVSDGFRFRDSTTDPWIDFTWPGTPWQYITVEFDDASGAAHFYQAGEGTHSFTSIVRERDDSAGSILVSYYQYAAGPLDIIKREVWESAARVVYIEFVVTNTSTSAITNFRIIHAVDCDQGRPTTYDTYNDLMDNDGDGIDEWVESAYPSTGRTMGYGICDLTDELGHTDWDDDADATFTDEGGAAGDLTMHWRHSESSIAALGTASFGFIVAVDTTPADANTEYTTATSTYCGGCDSDGDGYLAGHCGGGDCDDTSSTISPGMPELCDGIDNDCDSTTADGSGDTRVGAACDGTDSDLCEEGTNSCTSGAIVCSDTTGDDLDVCDGSDNDCNTTTPDGAHETWYGAACDGADSDLCEEGVEDCVSGSRACTDTTGDTVEVCDGADNDCDGAIDEDGVCGDPEPDTSTDTETDTTTDTATDTGDDTPSDVPSDTAADTATDTETDTTDDVPTDTAADTGYDVTGDTDISDTEDDTGGGPSGRASTGCGCEVVGGSGTAGSLLVLSMMLVLLGLRRRQR